MAVTERHPFVGLHYRATTHFARQIYIANTAGHITSPTSKAASWKAQRILAQIYSRHLCASETCWSEVISLPLPFCVSCVKLANTLMTHFKNFYTCKDKPLQPGQPTVIQPNQLLLYTSWKSYKNRNQDLSHCLWKTVTGGGVICQHQESYRKSIPSASHTNSCWGLSLFRNKRKQTTSYASH